MRKKEVTIDRSFLQVILLKPLFCLMRSTRIYQNCKFFWGESGGGLSEGERVGLSLREGMVEQALVGGLLGGNTWQCLCGNLLRMGSLGKQELGVWVARAGT